MLASIPSLLGMGRRERLRATTQVQAWFVLHSKTDVLSQYIEIIANQLPGCPGNRLLAPTKLLRELSAQAMVAASPNRKDL